MKAVLRRTLGLAWRALRGLVWLVARVLTIAGAVLGMRGNPALPPDHAPTARRDHRP